MAAIVKKCGCDCSQMIGPCNCGTARAETACRFKSATAEICGIPEFADPPEHWFRRRQTTGMMTLSKYFDAECAGAISVDAALSCRSKAATGHLIGFSEFANASSPPKKYLTSTWSGIVNVQNRPGCGSDDGTWQWGGVQSYDPITGAATNGAIWDRNPGGGGSPGMGGVPYMNDGGSQPPVNGYCGCGEGIGNITCFADKQSGGFLGNGICVDCGGGPGNINKVTGSAEANLTDEDTIANAVARGKAAIESWSSAGSCGDHTSYTNRNPSNFDVGFRAAQTQFNVPSGLLSGKSYEGRIHVSKRAYGSGDPFVDTGSPIIVHFTASAADYTSDWQDLPNEDGWEFVATSVQVFGEIEQLTVDAWDIDEVFNSGTCAQSVNDLSHRTVDGDPATGPFDHVPPDAYVGLAGVTTTPTLRTTAGSDTCVPDGSGHYLQANGTVQEQLSQEDTDQDAAGRAMAAISDWTGGGCDLPAFITARTAGTKVFGFRWLQIRAALSGTGAAGGSPKTYRLTWRTYRRQNGTSLAYAYYGDLIQEVTAVADSMDTPWIDVPNEAGWDTKIAGNPKVELVA